MSALLGETRQSAAIPVLNGHVCLVRSSNGRRWVIPKGYIERGQTAGETALREAWEEAGLLGALHAEPVGSYRYQKSGRQFHVTVFWMEVTDSADAWPEQGWRQRRWLAPARALEEIADASLRKLLGQVLIAKDRQAEDSPSWGGLSWPTPVAPHQFSPSDPSPSHKLSAARA